MTNIDFSKQKKWLVTGAAGFIGSHLVEFLLKNNQIVVGLDNFSTGFQKNLDDLLDNVGLELAKNFTFIKGDLQSVEDCLKASKGVEVILHQGALGSVPKSIEFPEATHASNVNGMFNILNAARINGVKSFVYASSSSVYGDEPELPKKEDKLGNLLSPYAASKLIDEIYASVFAKCYQMNIIGIRYFNVFGPRQSIDGPYAAVIPTWTHKLIKNEQTFINGDGTTSRDFTYIDNVVDINVRAAFKAMTSEIGHLVINAGALAQTNLKELHQLIVESLGIIPEKELEYKPFRDGDILHSFADISKAEHLLNYKPLVSIEEGVSRTVKWFANEFKG